MNCKNCGYCHGTAIEECIAVAERRGAKKAHERINHSIYREYGFIDSLTLRQQAQLNDILNAVAATSVKNVSTSGRSAGSNPADGIKHFCVDCGSESIGIIRDRRKQPADGIKCYCEHGPLMTTCRCPCAKCRAEPSQQHKPADGIKIPKCECSPVNQCNFCFVCRRHPLLGRHINYTNRREEARR